MEKDRKHSSHKSKKKKARSVQDLAKVFEQYIAEEAANEDRMKDYSITRRRSARNCTNNKALLGDWLMLEILSFLNKKSMLNYACVSKKCYVLATDSTNRVWHSLAIYEVEHLVRFKLSRYTKAKRAVIMMPRWGLLSDDTTSMEYAPNTLDFLANLTVSTSFCR